MCGVSVWEGCGVGEEVACVCGGISGSRGYGDHCGQEALCAMCIIPKYFLNGNSCLGKTTLGSNIANNYILPASVTSRACFSVSALVIIT